MRYPSIVVYLLCTVTAASAFTSHPAFASVSRLPQQHRDSVLFSSTIEDRDAATDSYKEALLNTAERLKKEYGTLLIDKFAKKNLHDAVQDLEANSKPPAVVDYKENFIGDWTLLCSTSTSFEGVDTSNLPFLGIDPIKKIREKIRDNANKFVKVQQRIRSTKNDGVVDRVDHVLEFDPPAKLDELIDDVPPQLASINLNPFEIKKSKVILVHKANIVTEMPLVTKLGLTSVILNVAGTSTYLDPDGRDIGGINLPLGDFLNTGAFETTYLDKSLRISRGKIGTQNVLRVFVRSFELEKEEALEDVIESETLVGEGVESDLDVDDFRDPEFDAVEPRMGATDDVDEDDENKDASNNDDDETKSP